MQRRFGSEVLQRFCNEFRRSQFIRTALRTTERELSIGDATHLIEHDFGFGSIERRSRVVDRRIGARVRSIDRLHRKIIRTCIGCCCIWIFSGVFAFYLRDFIMYFKN